MRNELSGELRLVHIHSCKETENFLLVPAALDGAVARALDERSHRTGKTRPTPEPMIDVLERLTAGQKSEITSQIVARRDEFLPRSRTDKATITRQSLQVVDAKWDSVEARMSLLPAKQVLSDLNTFLQEA